AARSNPTTTRRLRVTRRIDFIALISFLRDIDDARRQELHRITPGDARTRLTFGASSLRGARASAARVPRRGISHTPPRHLVDGARRRASRPSPADRALPAGSVWGCGYWGVATERLSETTWTKPTG